MGSSGMRVLHISTWNIQCGIATYCDNLVKALAASGVENDVFPICPHQWTSALPRDVDQLNSDILAAAADADVVHVQHEHGLFGIANGSGYAAKQYGRILRGLRGLGKPVVTTFHTELISPSPAQRMHKLNGFIRDWMRHRKWRARVAHQFGVRRGEARAIVHSARTRYAFARAGLPIDSIHFMPHACLPQRQFKIDRYKAKSLLKIPGHCKLLTIFGFVGRYKGHDLAVNALKQLPEDYRLAICGGAHPESRDDFLTHLMSQIKEAGLQDRVTITGWLPTESAELYYAATDICLAPYRADSGLSASGALTWALSSNRPIIASKIDAFQPIQRESGAMMMITADALEELCWAIQRLADDEVLQERLVQAAGNYVEKHSWRKNAENTIQLYEQMLFQQGRRSGRPHSDPVLVKIFAEDQGTGADQESEDSGTAAKKIGAA